MDKRKILRELMVAMRTHLQEMSLVSGMLPVDRSFVSHFPTPSPTLKPAIKEELSLSFSQPVKKRVLPAEQIRPPAAIPKKEPLKESRREFDEMRQTFRELFPELLLHSEVEKMTFQESKLQTPLVILLFHSAKDAEDLPFLKKLASALNERGMRTEWVDLLKQPPPKEENCALILLSATSTFPQCKKTGEFFELFGNRALPLLPATTYQKENGAKRLLWTSLCKLLNI